MAADSLIKRASGLLIPKKELSVGRPCCCPEKEFGRPCIFCSGNVPKKYTVVVDGFEPAFGILNDTWTVEQTTDESCLWCFTFDEPIIISPFFHVIRVCFELLSGPAINPPFTQGIPPFTEFPEWPLSEFGVYARAFYVVINPALFPNPVFVFPLTYMYDWFEQDEIDCEQTFNLESRFCDFPDIPLPNCQTSTVTPVSL